MTLIITRDVTFFGSSATGQRIERLVYNNAEDDRVLHKAVRDAFAWWKQTGTLEAWSTYSDLYKDLNGVRPTP